jgi:hypothetical protein
MQTPDKVPDRSRPSKGDVLTLVAAASLALAGLKASDPWVVLPMLAISWVAFLCLCLIHARSVIIRLVMGAVITAVFVFVTFRAMPPYGLPGVVKVPGARDTNSPNKSDSPARIGDSPLHKSAVPQPDGESLSVHEIGQVAAYSGGHGLITSSSFH